MEPRLDALLRRIQSLSESGAYQALAFSHVSYGGRDYPLYALTAGDPALPAVVLSAGTHGDEPEGVFALLDFLAETASEGGAFVQHRVLALPCLNPSGLEAGTRANAAGQDINRQFHRSSTPETAAVRAFLSWERVAAVADLHTDARASGFYLFELLQANTPSYAPHLVQTVQQAGFPLDAAPFFGSYVGRDGMIVPGVTEITDFLRLAPGAALVQWAWQENVPRCYVLETPQGAGEDACRAMHHIALAALRDCLEGIPDVATAE